MHIHEHNALIIDKIRIAIVHFKIFLILWTSVAQFPNSFICILDNIATYLLAQYVE